MPLIAETGGINAMIVDCSALPEQVVDGRDHLRVRQRGPALFGAALLCLQDDIADRVLRMLHGAMASWSSAIRAIRPPMSAR